MKCKYCGGQIPQDASHCPYCGAVLHMPTPQHTQAVGAQNQSAGPIPGAPKSKLSFMLLAFFLGGLGIHNFYIGNSKRGVLQLVLWLVTIWFGIGFAVWIWALVEMFTVKTDAWGRPLV